MSGKWGTGTDRERHERNIEIAKAARQNRKPTLESQCDRYHEMADQTKGVEKAQWEALAHELDVRLGRVGPKWEDVGLPFE